MLKKLISFYLIAGVFLFLAKPARAAETTLHFFWSEGCPHCAEEKIFLSKLKNKYPGLSIRDYEITYNRQNLELLRKVGAELQANVSGVPFTIIGKEYFAGYLSEETTGKKIERAVKCAIEDGCEDLVAGLSSEKKVQSNVQRNEDTSETLKVPILGEIQVKNLSLPMLTFVIAFMDGFNPCAMWALLFLISLLLGMKDRRRMWLLGGTFIASSAGVYFLFLSAWLNLFLFLGFVAWIRILVGLAALGAGGYNLRDYWINKSGACNIMGNEKRQRVFEKIRGITQKRQLAAALGGIILLAVAVNMVELICSAGLPAIYTQILSLSSLPHWQYYLYLLFYIFVFMLDDLFVFATAMVTLQAVGIQSKYSRYSHLIGGGLMTVIGLLLLFKPEWLMFG